jgi:hypothetical protein
MSCNHPKKSISKHEILAPVRVASFGMPFKQLRENKMEGNMPSMDTYTNQNQVFMYALSADVQ